MDFVGVNDRRAFVIAQLNMYAGAKKSLKDSTLILCPFHAERTPSGRIFHSSTSNNPGYFRCYGCGTRSTWNELAPKIGLSPYGKTKPKTEYANFQMLDITEADLKSNLSFVHEKMDFTELPSKKKWREIKTYLLRDLGAKFCVVDHPEHGKLKKKVYLPCFINKKLRGYIKARIDKHPDFPSYVNASGSWSKTHGLFPYDYALQLMRELHTKTVVLVEGPRDALRLIQYGIPAMCILGTHSWSPNKSKLLELGGVAKVVLMMDGDCAGIDAADLLKPILEEMFAVRMVKLWSIKGSPYLKYAKKKEPSKAAKAAGVSLYDPGNCPTWILDKIKSTFFERK